MSMCDVCEYSQVDSLEVEHLLWSLKVGMCLSNQQLLCQLEDQKTEGRKRKRGEKGLEKDMCNWECVVTRQIF